MAIVRELLNLQLRRSWSIKLIVVLPKNILHSRG